MTLTALYCRFTPLYLKAPAINSSYDQWCITCSFNRVKMSMNLRKEEEDGSILSAFHQVTSQKIKTG